MGKFVVFGIIGILAVLFFVSASPDSRLLQSRDNQRRSDLTILVEALESFSKENNLSVPQRALCIGKTPCLNLEEKLVPKYLDHIPADPLAGTQQNTLYFIYKDQSGKFVASAAGELTPQIVVSN